MQVTHRLLVEKTDIAKQTGNFVYPNECTLGELLAFDRVMSKPGVFNRANATQRGI
jgi:hypothetical protein